MSVKEKRGAWSNEDLMSQHFLQLFINHLRTEHDYSQEMVDSLLKHEEKYVPLCIFSHRISCLETIVKFLKENIGLALTEIASLLHRNYVSIYTTYRNSKKKYPERFIITDSKHLIPASILAERKYSVLESIVVFLKEEKELTLHKIAELLHRDDRTIWTVYNRAKKKANEVKER